MKIGINLLYLLPGVVGGTETYAAGLLHGMSQISSPHEYLVFVNRESAEWPLPDGPFTRIICNVNASNVYSRYMFEQLILPQLLRKHRIDLLHSLGYVTSLFSGIKNVVTIHDINTVGHGKNMPLHRKLLLGTMVKLSARRADHVVTVSQFSKEEIIKYVGVDKAKITVVHEAAETIPSIQSEGLKPMQFPEPYITAFSSQSHHKNLLNFLKAFQKINERFPHHLVLIGHTPSDSLIQAELANSALQNRVHFTGYVHNETKHQILRGSTLFVFPSLYEGFGLPLLEAQQEGVCVCSSDAGSLPEIGLDSACYFNGRSINNIVSAIESLLEDDTLRASFVAKGRKNVQRFSWKRAAIETLDIYNHVTTQKFK